MNDYWRGATVTTFGFAFIAFVIAMNPAYCQKVDKYRRSASPQPTINLPVTVYHIVDGDTVDVEATIRFRVRLLECWAPESRTRDLDEKKLGLASKENMTKIALGKSAIVVIPLDRVRLRRIDDLQSLSRWLSYLHINGKSVSELQVEGGFATKLKPRKEAGIDP